MWEWAPSAVRIKCKSIFQRNPGLNQIRPRKAPMNSRPISATATIFAKEAYYELLKYIRIPMYAGSTLLFPVMFYILFGLVMNRDTSMGRIGVSTYLIATYGTFGVMGASLFANGIGVAVERGLGWMQ